MYQNNHCGFNTSRPMVWIDALELYTTTNDDVTCIWKYKPNNVNKYEECRLTIFYNKVKQIKMFVYIKTGIIMVKGPLYKDFIVNEFVKIVDASKLNTLISPMNNITLDIEKDGENEENNKETEKELLMVWENMSSNRNAINIIENKIESLTSEMNHNHESQEEKSKKYDVDLINLEKKYDTKLCIFMATYKEEFQKDLRIAIEKINNKIDNIQNVIGQFKISVQDQMNTFKNEKEQMEQKYTEWSNTPLIKDIEIPSPADMAALKTSIDFNNDNIEELKTECQAAMKKLTEVVNNNFSKPHLPAVNPSINHQSHQNKKGVKTDFNENLAADLMICIDSNRKYINFRKLWTINGTERKFLGNLHELRTAIRNENQIKELKYILIHIGVNDLDTKPGKLVFQELCEVIGEIRRKYPGIIIVLSEITPRNDNRDVEVKICNEHLSEWVKDQANIYLAKHSNLRDPEWSMFTDTKHVSEAATARLASNLKRALREAYGVTKPYIHRSSFVRSYPKDRYPNDRNNANSDITNTNRRLNTLKMHLNNFVENYEW